MKCELTTSIFEFANFGTVKFTRVKPVHNFHYEYDVVITDEQGRKLGELRTQLSPMGMNAQQLMERASILEDTSNS